MIPLTRATGLLGISQAAAATRDAIDVVLRLRSVQTGASALALRSAEQGARASALLETASESLADDDPVLAGALRATHAASELATLWPTAPLQVLARLHLLAAVDVAVPDDLGRPTDATSARRLQSMVAEIARSAGPGSSVPSVVVAAIVHAEVASAFQPLGGVVGRAAERAVLASTGVDRTSVLVPEQGHLDEAEGYLTDRARLLTGTDVAVATWSSGAAAPTRREPRSPRRWWGQLDRRDTRYQVRAPAATAAPAPAAIATVRESSRSRMARRRSATGWLNTSTGQPRAAASRRRARSGLTASGARPRRASAGR